MRKAPHSFEVHSNESACRKKVRLGLEQVITMEDTSSPTISLEAIMTILVVEKYIGRDIAIFDVPRAYLNIAMLNERYVRLKFHDEFMYIMCGVNPYQIPNIP